MWSSSTPNLAKSVALPILKECERICKGISQNCKHFWSTELNWYSDKHAPSKWTNNLFEPFKPEKRNFKKDCRRRAGHKSLSGCLETNRITDLCFWSVFELKSLICKVLQFLLKDTSSKLRHCQNRYCPREGLTRTTSTTPCRQPTRRARRRGFPKSILLIIIYPAQGVTSRGSHTNCMHILKKLQTLLGNFSSIRLA
jgi:hypothetical protein